MLGSQWDKAKKLSWLNEKSKERDLKDKQKKEEKMIKMNKLIVTS